jgi:hypothetical protein
LPNDPGLGELAGLLFRSLECVEQFGIEHQRVVPFR